MFILAGIHADGSKRWVLCDTLEAMAGLAAQWRAEGLRDITFGSVIPYTATIRIAVGDQVIELPVPDVG